jgi:glucokinase
VIPTPAQATQLDLMQHLHNQVRRAMLDSNVKVGSIGIATAGWVDPHTGAVVHATANLPTWSGAPIARTLRDTFQIPVFVENDANAFALAEGLFGAARGVQNYFTVTLGTGVGGGVVMNGRLLRGAHNLGNALGHICIEPDGLLCTCGQKGCLEAYCNLAALARYNGSLEPLADSLARGLASLIHAYDPELIVIAGGIAQSNPKLIALLEARLAQLVFAWEKRHVRIAGSTLGYEAGVLGAAALCFQD